MMNTTSSCYIFNISFFLFYTTAGERNINRSLTLLLHHAQHASTVEVAILRQKLKPLTKHQFLMRLIGSVLRFVFSGRIENVFCGCVPRVRGQLTAISFSTKQPSSCKQQPQQV